ncbi:MAG: DUF362 domain-containing protein, partial [Polyangiaceae bacterium]|nr:DUF362 domain-containing protein [Polyangiaceae bacterium]
MSTVRVPPVVTVTPRHPIYSQDASVFWETGRSGEAKTAVFERLVAAAGFFDHVEAAWRLSQKDKDTFDIVVKPNIMTASQHEVDSPVYTDPELVEWLLHELRRRGYRRLAVVEAQNVFNYSYLGRTVPAVAEMCGYAPGRGYDIVDLSADVVAADYGGELGHHPVGRRWHDADYRISFAKNKTHWQSYYTACLKNVYGCLPQWDKMYHYHGKGIEFWNATVLMADRFPVHFGFLDAWVSGDGLSGHVRDAKPNRTRTFCASPNIFALDWVAGLAMGLDPLRNPVIAEALAHWGPIEISAAAPLPHWRDWHNVSRLTVFCIDKLEEWYWVSRFFSRAMAASMDRRFPPVGRGQWLYGFFQFWVRLFERLTVTAASA